MSVLQDVKSWMVDHVDLPKDALHVYVGLAVFVGSAALFRWRLSGWRPWALAAAAALGGELWDIRDSISENRPIHPWRNWHDVWNTLLWPTTLLLLARAKRLRA